MSTFLENLVIQVVDKTEQCQEGWPRSLEDGDAIGQNVAVASDDQPTGRHRPIRCVDGSGYLEDWDAGPKTEFVQLVWRRRAGGHVLGDLPDIETQASELGQHPARPRLVLR